MLWSPDIMFVWYFWSILILFFLFQNNMQFLFILKYISFISKNEIVKSLMDPLKGTAPLNGLIGYNLRAGDVGL